MIGLRYFGFTCAISVGLYSIYAWIKFVIWVWNAPGLRGIQSAALVFSLLIPAIGFFAGITIGAFTDHAWPHPLDVERKRKEIEREEEERNKRRQREEEERNQRRQREDEAWKKMIQRIDGKQNANESEEF